MFNVYESDFRTDPIPLGNRGEDNARCLIVNITAVLSEFGTTGTLEVRNQRPGEGLPYVVSNSSIVSGTDPQGNPLYYGKWVLDDTDTGRAGVGEVQFRYSISDVDCFTWIFHYCILPSLGAAGSSPSPYEDLVDTVQTAASTATAAASTAVDAKDTAVSASSTATSSASTAIYNAQLAQAAAETAVQHGYAISISGHKIIFTSPST